MSSRPLGLILLILVCAQSILMIVGKSIGDTISSRRAFFTDFIIYSIGTMLNRAVGANKQAVSNQQMMQKTERLTQAQQAVILQINQEARQRSLTVMYYALGVIGLNGLVGALQVPHLKPFTKS
jgi:hypothetical protein